MNIKLLHKLRQALHKDKTIMTKKQHLSAIKFIEKLPEPKNLFDRSFLQYKCQQFVSGNFLFDNLISHVVKKKYIKKCLSNNSLDNLNIEKRKPIALYFDPLGTSIIPDDLKEKYDIIETEFNDNCLLNEDIAFINEIDHNIKNNPFFKFKCICKIAQYRAKIIQYKPDAIIATSEYSFTSSILTEFCRRNNVLHLNVMHGEKWFDLVASYFQFDTCYVWDEHYINLFKSMKANVEQFVVSVPDSLKFDNNYEKTCDIKFYLEIENKKSILHYKRIADVLIQRGISVSFRPHPRCTDLTLLKKIIPYQLIEDFKTVNIQESIMTSKKVVATHSTVLYQAYLNNIEVVINDMTNPKLYKALPDLKHIMLQKPHTLLSQLLNNNFS